MAILTPIRSLDELRLENERVFIRADLDVPCDPQSGTVTDDHAIRAALSTIQYAVEADARVVVGAHLGSPGGRPSAALSLEPVALRLAELGDWEVLLPDDCVGDSPRKVIADLREGQVCLLENLRFHPGEERNDEAFARKLACLCDVYVNEALSLAGDRHASLLALPRLVRQRGCGLALSHELRALTRLVEHVERPCVVILGGSGLSEKLALFQALAPKCDAVCFGGAAANTLLAARGTNLHGTPVEQDQLAQGRTVLGLSRNQGPEILLPCDVVVAPDADAPAGRVVAVEQIPAGHVVVDIGTETVARFRQRVLQARTVFWNGPVGQLHNRAFRVGTEAVARALADSPGFTMVAGSRTASAVRDTGPEVVERIGLVSSGGEATLKLLQGQRLAALEALRAGHG
jgi:phosphoglycerate kinase